MGTAVVSDVLGEKQAGVRGWRHAADPEHVVALALSGTRARREQTAGLAAAALAAADVDRLTAHLDRQRLLPLLGTRLLEAHSDISSSFRERVTAAVDATAGVQMFHMMALMRVHAALERAGVEALPIKGPQLARALYPQAGMRQSGDLDLVVPAARLDDGVATLRELGYSAPRDPRGRNGLPLLHLQLFHEEGLPSVELHWRVHWYEGRFAADMLERSSVVGQERRATRSDELVTLLLLFARDGFAGLRMATDIAAWWDLHGSDVARDALDVAASRYPRLAPALRAAAMTAQRVVGAPLLTIGPPSGSPVARRVTPRLANWALTGSDKQIDANASLVDGLLTVRGGRRAFLRRALVPSRDVVALRQPELAARGTQALALGYVQVAPRVLRRFAIALWAVRGGRRWPPPLPTR